MQRPMNGASASKFSALTGSLGEIFSVLSWPADARAFHGEFGGVAATGGAGEDVARFGDVVLAGKEATDALDAQGAPDADAVVAASEGGGGDEAARLGAE